MPTALLDGVRVVDLAGEPAAMTGRILADLGADVVLVEPPDGHPLRDQPDRFAAWAAGKRSVVVTGPDDATLAELLAGADIVVATPGFPETLDVDPSGARRTPCGAGHPVRRVGAPGRLAGVGPRGHGGERQHVFDG